MRPRIYGESLLHSDRSFDNRALVVGYGADSLVDFPRELEQVFVYIGLERLEVIDEQIEAVLFGPMYERMLVLTSVLFQYQVIEVLASVFDHACWPHHVELPHKGSADVGYTRCVLAGAE